MPRNMSFMLTTEQFKNRTKFVTRRNGWEFLQEGDILNGCEKCQGLKKGEKIVKLGQIKVQSVKREPLRAMTDNLAYGLTEVFLEGFPHMTPAEFVEMYCKHNKCTPDTVVTRVTFRYI